MKNRKKIMAVLLAAALATTSMTALAGSETQSSTGISAIENDNSKLPEAGMYDVILPTIADDTYNFTIDHDQLLKSFDEENNYSDDSYVYFNTVATPATVTVTGNNKFFEIGYSEDNASSFETAVLTASGSSRTVETMKAKFKAYKAANSPKTTLGYYVWAPDTSDRDSGNGKWEEITEDNLDKLFDLDYEPDGVEIKAKGAGSKTKLKNVNNMSETSGFLFDGKIYKKEYIAIAASEGKTEGEKIAEHISYDSKLKGKEAYSFDGKLYYAPVSANAATTTPVAVTTASTEALFVKSDRIATYKKAETLRTDTSEEATVVNKSAYPIAVTAKVKLVSANGITVTGNSIASNVTQAVIRLGVSTVSGGTFETSNVQYVSGTATNTSTPDAELSYVLKSKYDTDSSGKVDIALVSGKSIGDLELNKYQGADDAKVTTTGSFNYYNYKKADVYTATSPAVSFAIKAEISGSTYSAIGWKEYVDSLVKDNASNFKPTLKVIYHFDAVEQSEKNEKLYTASGGSIQYLVSGSAINNVATSSGLTISESIPVKSSVPATVRVPASGDVTIPVTVGSAGDELTKLETSLYTNKFDGDLLRQEDGYGATYSNRVIKLNSDIAAYIKGASSSELNEAIFTATFSSGSSKYTQTFKFTK